MMLVTHPIPSDLSQRMVCDVLNINRTTLRKALQTHQFVWPTSTPQSKPEALITAQSLA